ncbi:J domain-containing protein [Pseudomonas sichuanensis]|uniref:J domain-containing protein n=1 Tax=Pseudomonas sichuanensis TaxID=2213015 RepID=UPI00215E4EAA|nr:J domain-containing protein [Pseudomonas sichuanensis]UVL90604.1 J domain-containing protein [Pseudomonas sichuanensis]
MSCWIRLGIDPTNDLDAIRLAYRGRLPAHHPETDPEGFKALRAAYDEALRLAREQEATAVDANEQPAEEAAAHPALISFHTLLEEPALRFDPQAWQRYIAELDELPLDELDELSWQLLRALYDCGPLSHQCAGMLARRLAWDQQLLRLENPQPVEAFLRRLDEPDPFDTGLMRDWPPTAQMETLWYLRSLEHCFTQRPLFEYEQFASVHTCLAMPNDQALVERLMVQFSQAGIASSTFHGLLQERLQQAPDDADLLYLLARQADALGAEQQALDCWLRLHREHRHPQAERWLLDLCARHQPQRLPLLIQAFDLQHTPAAWPAELADPAQAWGSPGQAPQTLARWAEAARLELGGIAATFVDWRLDGDDELPLLAWLLQEQDEHALHQRYWQAWALQRGEAELLGQILAQHPSEDPLDALILEGFQRQAAQQLHWLSHAPVCQALTRYCADTLPGAELPAALSEDAIHPVCREWLRRLRCYSAQAVYELNNHFNMPRMFTVPFALHLQGRLAEDGVVLPAMPEGEALWQWHRQQLFMLAMIDQPTRWLALIDPALPGQLQYPQEHPFAATHALLLRHPSGGLLGNLDPSDPLQAQVAARMANLQQALNSDRLPSAKQLAQCLGNDDGSVLAKNPLGYLLFCAVLYHDRSLDEALRSQLRERLEAIQVTGDWFAPWRADLLKGKTRTVPNWVLREHGIDRRLVSDLLEALDALLERCTRPTTRVLRALQKHKDNPREHLGLRCAIMALLGWSERMLLKDLQSKPTPFWAVWKLNSRLDRTGFGLHLVAIALCYSLMLTVPALMVVVIGLLISALLRRLRDLGRGIPSLVLLVLLSRLLPVVPLLLLGLPGDRLPNRYGSAPGQPGLLDDSLQATLRRLNGQ